MMPVLQVEGLSKHFKNFSLKGVTFEIPAGYIMGLIGPNGAGKTTLIKLILHLLRKDWGEIKLFGLNYPGNEVKIKDRVGFVFEEPRFYKNLRLHQTARILAPFYSRWDWNDYHGFLHRFGLDGEKRFDVLSKGERMKYALVIAFSHHPDLLLLDEPTSGLDPVFRHEILDILQEIIADEGRSVLFSTHITSDLDKIADYVTYLSRGEVILSTSKHELDNNWGIVKGADMELLAANRNSFQQIRTGKFGWTALTSDLDSCRRVLRDRVVYERLTLEELMIFQEKGGDDV